MAQMSDVTEQNSVRHRLYALMDDDELSLVEKQRRAVSLGREFLAVENGHIQRRNRDGSTDSVVVSVGDNPDILPEGTVLDRATTYCRRTVKAHSPIALSNAPEQGWEDDPAYKRHEFDCYLGTTIFVRGEVYGTVCFISREARQAEFTSEEQAFVELIARLLGRELEASEYEADLDQSQQAKQRSEEKYEAFLQLAPDAVFVADAQSKTITEVNEKAARLTGYPEVDLRGMSVLDLHPQAERERYAALFESGFDESPRERFDDGTPLILSCADGSQLPIEMSLTTFTVEGQRLVQGIVRDVSARRERERDLHLKSKALEASTVGITIADAADPNLPIVYANEGFTKLTGYPQERVLGSNCRFLQGADTDEETVAEIRTAIEHNEPIQTEILNYRSDGAPFWNKLTIAPVTGESSETVEHYVGIQEDITAKKRRDRLLTVLDRVLRHNLRNAMTTVMGYAGAVADRTEGETAAMATQIEEAARDLAALSEKARQFQTATRDADELGPRDIFADIETVVEGLQREYPAAEFRIEGSTTHDVMATDRVRLALRELGENAARHSNFSPVTFHVSSTDDEGVVIQVRDQGPGLPDSEQEVLRAGRETPLEHSSGLGLWLVNWIVSGLGGDVTVTVDDGTTVSVWLPGTTDGAVPDHRNAAMDTGG